MSKYYSKLASCGHCGNISKMEIKGSVQDNWEWGEDGHTMYDGGTTYSVLICPACNKVNIVRYDWHEDMNPDKVTYEVMYPHDEKMPIGLPTKILKAYKAAEKVKSVDVNAYALLLRRLLELVCIDKNATKGTLAEMLKELADNGDIPEKLVDVAKGLRNFGNVGAHATIGELGENEIPIIKALTSAILEYIYSAPHLATIAENKLMKIKNK